MNKYRLALDITANFQATNSRCARQYVELLLCSFLKHMDVSYRYVRINSKKLDELGDDE